MATIRRAAASPGRPPWGEPLTLGPLRGKAGRLAFRLADARTGARVTVLASFRPGTAGLHTSQPACLSTPVGRVDALICRAQEGLVLGRTRRPRVGAWGGGWRYRVLRVQLCPEAVVEVRLDCLPEFGAQTVDAGRRPG